MFRPSRIERFPENGPIDSAFNKRIHYAEIELQRLDIEITPMTKYYLFLMQIYHYHDPVFRQKVSEYLATSKDDGKFSNSREDVVEEFMKIESVKNIVGDNNSKETGNMNLKSLLLKMVLMVSR